MIGPHKHGRGAGIEVSLGRVQHETCSRRTGNAVGEDEADARAAAGTGQPHPHRHDAQRGGPDAEADHARGPATASHLSAGMATKPIFSHVTATATVAAGTSHVRPEWGQPAVGLRRPVTEGHGADGPARPIRTSDSCYSIVKAGLYDGRMLRIQHRAHVPGGRGRGSGQRRGAQRWATAIGGQPAPARGLQRETGLALVERARARNPAGPRRRWPSPRWCSLLRARDRSSGGRRPARTAGPGGAGSATSPRPARADPAGRRRADQRVPAAAARPAPHRDGRDVFRPDVEVFVEHAASSPLEGYDVETLVDDPYVAVLPDGHPRSAAGAVGWRTCATRCGSRTTSRAARAARSCWTPAPVRGSAPPSRSRRRTIRRRSRSSPPASASPSCLAWRRSPFRPASAPYLWSIRFHSGAYKSGRAER